MYGVKSAKFAQNTKISLRTNRREPVRYPVNRLRYAVPEIGSQA
jgi:hypothetical protein